MSAKHPLVQFERERMKREHNPLNCGRVVLWCSVLVSTTTKELGEGSYEGGVGVGARGGGEG